MVGEVLQFENEVFGEVFNLEQDGVGAVIYGDYTRVKEGSDVTATGRLMSVPVGDHLLGRIVNPLCEPVTAGLRSRPLHGGSSSPMPGIAHRQPVKKPCSPGSRASTR